jgi:alpha-L-fucosidase 2
MLLRFPGNEKYSDYTRELDLSEAVAKTRYRSNGAKFTRELFISYPDDAMVIRLKSDKAEALNFSLSMKSIHPTLKSTADGNSGFVFTGQVPGFVLRRTLEWVEERKQTWKYPEIWDKEGKRKPGTSAIMYDGKGIKFEVRLRVISCDGKISADAQGIEVKSAKEAVLAISVATSFNGFDKDPVSNGSDPAEKTKATIQKIASKSYQQLVKNHLTDYQKLFGRVSLDLPSSKSQSSQPTDLRKAANAKTLDPSLEALYFQYGRYLLISSSRPGGQPVNLQGLWNVDIVPPWGSNYTNNINIQMNYWPAETTNLSECTEPLSQFAREISVNGSKVATKMYRLPGWVLHHTTSLWRGAHPVDIDASTSFWPMAGGWICQHLWDHYLFTKDLDYLNTTAYPVMKGSAEFYSSWLKSDTNGYLVTPISTSPENQFLYINEYGRLLSSGMSAGSTLDMAIIRELFQNTIDAAKLLRVDPEFILNLEEKLAKLLPYQIGSKGQLLEFSKEFMEGPPRHNTSPFYPLYPGTQFTPKGTPALTESVKKLIVSRTGNRMTGGGWPGAWHAALWARLKEGDTCLPYLSGMINRTFLNLFNGGGNVFQIDGNLGYTASVTEMLIQSHEGEIELLPALPKAWNTGSFKGLCARGGFVVDVSWEGGKIKSAFVASQKGGKCTVRFKEKKVDIKLKAGERIRLSQL